jgi:hypothetical protein
VYTVYTQKNRQIGCVCTSLQLLLMVCVPAGVYAQCVQCTHSVYTHAKCLNFGASTAVYHTVVRQYRMSARCMATSDIRSSTSSSGFSIRIFLRTKFSTQICRIVDNLFDFSKVVLVHRFSTSWDSEFLFSRFRRQSYAIMATVPSIYTSPY